MLQRFATCRSTVPVMPLADSQSDKPKVLEQKILIKIFGGAKLSAYHCGMRAIANLLKRARPYGNGGKAIMQTLLLRGAAGNCGYDGKQALKYAILQGRMAFLAKTGRVLKNKAEAVQPVDSFFWRLNEKL